jgi:hypothetical protein
MASATRSIATTEQGQALLTMRENGAGAKITQLLPDLLLAARETVDSHRFQFAIVHPREELVRSTDFRERANGSVSAGFRSAGLLMCIP